MKRRGLGAALLAIWGLLFSCVPGAPPNPPPDDSPGLNGDPAGMPADSDDGNDPNDLGDTGQPDDSGDPAGSENPDDAGEPVGEVEEGDAPTIASWAVPPPLMAPPPAPAIGVTTLLNEVAFQPPGGESPYVELKIGTGGAEPSQLVLVNELGEVYALPDGLGRPEAGGMMLIRFDGLNFVEGSAIHADRVAFLNPHSGSVDLRDDSGAALDRVAWGDDAPDAVAYGQGGTPTPLLPGVAIARLPLSTEVGPEQWTGYWGQDATPGAPNPNPSLGVLFPTNGSWLPSGAVELSWYPIASATQYQVQVAMQDAFDALLMDQTVDAPQVMTDVLALGTYYWRARPIFMDGSIGDFSVTHEFTIDDSIDLSADGTTSKLAVRRKGVPPMKVLPIGTIAQHKDTALILLESMRTDAAHRWDAPHTTPDRTDAADNRNCTLASVVMVNHYYGGTLSQDRLGFEFKHEPHRHDTPGPEGDLNWGVGHYPERLLEWGLGLARGDVRATYLARHDAANFGQFWGDVVDEIDAGRPVVLVKWVNHDTHTMVAVGYHVSGGKRLVIVNNPWSEAGNAGARAPIEFDKIPVSYYCRINAGAVPKINARRDEDSIRHDSDGDGVMDFDETMRFGTNPDDKDTDSDCIDDKDEIRHSMLVPRHGWALYRNKQGSDGHARDHKLTLGADNVPTAGRPELEMDYDGGGTPDLAEDTNFNGKLETDLGETDPFDSSDDSRKVTGTIDHVYEVTMQLPGNERYTSSFFRNNLHVDISLRTDQQTGKLTGTGKVKHVRFFQYQLKEETPCKTTTYNQTAPDREWTVELTGEFLCFDGEDGKVLAIGASGTPNGSGVLTTYTWDDGCQAHVVIGPVTSPTEWGNFLVVPFKQGKFDEKKPQSLGGGQSGQAYVETHVKVER